jgi:GNAT superfamily N-acetyltransferase
MLRIRRIYDNVLPVNKSTLNQVQEILRSRFSGVDEEEIAHIAEKLRNPFKQRFRTILFVAESIKSKVRGFAMLLHEPELHFAYLDWIATASGRAGGGIGGALYDRIRREATALKVAGLFFECLPDDADDCPDPAELKQNRARLRFYERYGARPIVNTGYESPVKPGETCMPHLVYDDLGTGKRIEKGLCPTGGAGRAGTQVCRLLSGRLCRKGGASFRDDPVHLRDFRYVKPEAVVASWKAVRPNRSP